MHKQLTLLYSNCKHRSFIHPFVLMFLVYEWTLQTNYEQHIQLPAGTAVHISMTTWQWDGDPSLGNSIDFRLHILQCLQQKWHFTPKIEPQNSSEKLAPISKATYCHTSDACLCIMTRRCLADTAIRPTGPRPPFNNQGSTRSADSAQYNTVCGFYVCGFYLVSVSLSLLIAKLLL